MQSRAVVRLRPAAGKVSAGSKGRTMPTLGSHFRRKHARIDVETPGELADFVLADPASPGQDVGDRGPGNARGLRQLSLG